MTAPFCTTLRHRFQAGQSVALPLNALPLRRDSTLKVSLEMLFDRDPSVLPLTCYTLRTGCPYFSTSSGMVHDLAVISNRPSYLFAANTFHLRMDSEGGPSTLRLVVCDFFSGDILIAPMDLIVMVELVIS